MSRAMLLFVIVLSVALVASCSLRPPDSYVHIRGMPLQKYNACLEKNRGASKETLDQLCRSYLDEKWQWAANEQQPQ